MKQKLRIKNIIIATSIIIAIASLVIFDHHRVNRDFRRLEADLMRIRLKSATENKSLVFKFNNNDCDINSSKSEVSVLEYRKGPLQDRVNGK